nr:NADH dehydrogenase subunit 2 [Trochus sp. n. CL-2022]
MFIFVMIFGTVFSISSSHWLGIWAGLEVNLIGFLPLLVYQKSQSESESAVKYFVVQALGSGLLIFGSLTGCNLSFTWEFLPEDLSFLSFLVIISGLIMKMGMFPFHFWLPSVMAGLPWLSCLLLATWQKIAPLFLVSCLFEINFSYYMVFLFCLLASGSSLIGGVGGMNQTQTRAILAYSSIGHLGWIIFASCQSIWVMKSYFVIYLLISVCVFSSLWFLNLGSMKSMSDLMALESSKVFSVMLMLLSLAGLPPLLGFISKWLVVSFSISNSTCLFLGFLIVGSLMSLFYYLSLYFSVFLSAYKKLYINNQLGLNISVITNLVVLLNLMGGLVLIFFSLLKSF